MSIKLGSIQMTKKRWTVIALIILVAAGLGAALVGLKKFTANEDAGPHEGAAARVQSAHDHNSGEAHAGDEAGGPSEGAQRKGQHGGTLLSAGDVELEVMLVEAGGEPRLRLWAFEKNLPLLPGSVKMSAVVTRWTGERETLSFEPEASSALSREVVEEPHAFNVEITAETAAGLHKFVFNQEEGKIALSDAQVKAASIGIEVASAGLIKSALYVPGEVRLNDDRTSHVVPRVPGVVESVSVGLGQVVKKGQILAVIASSVASEHRSELAMATRRRALAETTLEREQRLWNQRISAEQDYLQARQALQEADIAVTNAQQKLLALGMSATSTAGSNRIELRAPYDAVVIEKHLNLGEAVKEDATVLTLSDLNRVWVEMNVPAKDLPLIRVGEKVTIKAAAFDASAAGAIAYVGALIGEQTRQARARVVLENPQGIWRPGLFVNVAVTASEVEVPVAVRSDAVQTIADQTVVFVRVNGGFVAQPVVLGRSDGKIVEVVRGLSAGASYASTGSFVVKSELGKATAEHTH